ncbi:unnamed protein product [Macrosiphum euphorbiae]|uniref:Uncharacterized protein n=1 Tax=Macrosiphum euphorbiae TaxID=13131 RepID=A0AAV0XG01_9HEMI|nr:unnamed protein product [Macrosiphum euphorbiae]
MSRRSRAYFIGLMRIIPVGGKKTVSRKSMIICQRKYAFCQIPVLFVKTPVAPARLSTQMYMDFGGKSVLYRNHPISASVLFYSIPQHHHTLLSLTFKFFCSPTDEKNVRI